MNTARSQTRLARTLFSLALVLAAVCCFWPAQDASAAYAMPIYALSPASGSTLGLKPAESSTNVFFTSEASSYYNMVAGLTLEVATANVMSTDGTLSNDYNIDYDIVQQADSGPNQYKATIHNYRFTTPGVYYFQFSGYNVYSEFLVSPVYSFTFDPNAGGLDLSMQRSQAIGYIKYIVKANTKHSAGSLNSVCDRVNFRSFSCYSHFNAGGKKYQGKFVVQHVDQGDGQLYFSGKFKGEAASFSCLRRASRSACSKSVSWHT
jgi:hypothetical protein